MTILFPYMARWSSAHASRYYHLLTAVAEQGHDVIVLQPPTRGSTEANDIDVPLRTHSRVTVVTVNVGRLFWSVHFPFEKVLKKAYYTLRTITLVRRLVRQYRVDLLYLYDLPQAVYLPGRTTRVVFDVADDLLGMLQAELSISLRHPVYRAAQRLFRWILDRSDVVTCISAPLYESIHHPNKHILTNGTPAFKTNGQTPGTAHSVGAPLTVGYVGAFEYSMALDQAIEAAGLAPDIRFLLIGAGRELARIQQAVADRGLNNVELTGALPHDVAMDRIAATDVCLNVFKKTSVSHAVSPLKLFEYLALGKPVISTRLHEVERINRDFLYFADSAEEIVARLREIQADPVAAMTRADRGFQVVAKEFTWDSLAKQFLEAVRLPNGPSPTSM